MYGVLSYSRHDYRKLSTYLRRDTEGVRRLRRLRETRGDYVEPNVGMWTWKNSEEIKGWIE